MIDLLKIVAVALVSAFAYIIVKQTKPEMAIFITLVGSILIITMTVNSLKSVVSSFWGIFKSTGVDTVLLTALFKIIAIGYIAEFGANLCVDAGASSIADKILFSAKIIILMLALPIITKVVDLVIGLL